MVHIKFLPSLSLSTLRFFGIFDSVCTLFIGFRHSPLSRKQEGERWSCLDVKLAYKLRCSDSPSIIYGHEKIEMEILLLLLNRKNEGKNTQKTEERASDFSLFDVYAKKKSQLSIESKMCWQLCQSNKEPH